jgi:acyl dehydratase
MEYFEDVVIGETVRFGSYPVTREEVIDFAGKYDPQPFHLDDDAASKTYFGRLSASGWHTGAMMMRMMVDHMKDHQRAGLGSPGIDELRWIKPVYPGDTLRVEGETLSKRRSASRPEMGLIYGVNRVYNQHDELVMTMKSTGLIQVRDPSAPIDPAD